MVARLVSLRLLAMASVAVLALVVPAPRAFAQEDDEGGKKAAKGGGDEGEEEGEEGGKADKDQPKVTAGGLFTMETYPLNEVERPLTITIGIVELRADLVFDISKDVAFKTDLFNLSGRYGLLDTLELQVGANFTIAAPDGVSKPVSIQAGIEQAIVYDLVDARLTLSLPVNPKVTLDIIGGFPVKYRLNDKIAILALEKLITLHTSDDTTPDLTIGVGGVFQALDNLAIIARGEVDLVHFDPDQMAIPVEVDVQYTPSNHIDFGLEFRLGNLKASDPASPFDQRSFGLFARARL
jgi:hypothetical protein